MQAWLHLVLLYTVRLRLKYALEKLKLICEHMICENIDIIKRDVDHLGIT